MPITTYYDPKARSYTSGWKPSDSETTTDEWLSENMPWTDHSDDDLRRKLSRAGITPSAAVAMTPLSIFTGGAAANLTGMSERAIDGKLNEDDPYAPQRADVRDVGLKEYIKEGGMAAPDLSEEEQKHWDDYQDYQKKSLKDAVISGAQAGGWQGALASAVTSGVSSESGYAQSQIDEEEKLMAEAAAADSARLASESQITNARLSGGSGPNQSLSGSYPYEPPGGYDAWYKSHFS